MKQTIRRSSIALAVLAFLYEKPMHPYRMQVMIKQRGTDEVINVRQRASLYQTIERLLRAGLIAVKEVKREENWPERTVYQLTDTGRETMLLWLREMLASPAPDFPEFPAALAYLSLIPPEDARDLLKQRRQTLAAEVERIAANLSLAAQVPRLFLVEVEYLHALRKTELAWVESLIADLEAGRLTWNEAWIRDVAARLEGSDQEQQGG